jgi:hypothetical protein
MPAFITHPNTGEELWFNSVAVNNFSALKVSSVFPGNDKQHTLDLFIPETTYGY